jgi:hypothetical protein
MKKNNKTKQNTDCRPINQHKSSQPHKTIFNTRGTNNKNRNFLFIQQTKKAHTCKQSLLPFSVNNEKKKQIINKFLNRCTHTLPSTHQLSTILICNHFPSTQCQPFPHSATHHPKKEKENKKSGIERKKSF